MSTDTLPPCPCGGTPDVRAEAWEVWIQCGACGLQTPGMSGGMSGMGDAYAAAVKRWRASVGGRVADTLAVRVEHDEEWLSKIWSTRTTHEYNCGPDDCRAYHEHMVRREQRASDGWVSIIERLPPEAGPQVAYLCAPDWTDDRWVEIGAGHTKVHEALAEHLVAWKPFDMPALPDADELARLIERAEAGEG